MVECWGSHMHKNVKIKQQGNSISTFFPSRFAFAAVLTDIRFIIFYFLLTTTTTKILPHFTACISAVWWRNWYQNSWWQTTTWFSGPNKTITHPGKFIQHDFLSSLQDIKLASSSSSSSFYYMVWNSGRQVRRWRQTTASVSTIKMCLQQRGRERQRHSIHKGFWANRRLRGAFQRDKNSFMAAASSPSTSLHGRAVELFSYTGCCSFLCWNLHTLCACVFYYYLFHLRMQIIIIISYN